MRVECVGLDQNGKGLIRYKGKLIPVSGLLEKEVAEVEIIEKGRWTDTRLIEVLEPSRKRCKVSCKQFGKCGGCQLLHMNYADTLEFKQKQLIHLFRNDVSVPPVLGMKNPTHYRNKVVSTFTTNKKGNVTSGIYEEESHKIVVIDDCLIQNEVANQIIIAVRKCLKSFRIEPFNENKRTGFIRHVLIRQAKSTNQYMVVLVTVSDRFYGANNFAKALIKECPLISTVVMNVNDRATSMVLGDKEKVIYGKGFIEDELLGKRFKISSSSFYQINPSQCEVLYTKALDLARLSKSDRVLDAYCGTGTITLCAADKCGEVIGVELNRSAVKDANDNARKNNITNAKFICDDAADYMMDAAMNEEHFDVVIMDPPRSGSTEKFLKACLMLKPKKIVYISCNPVTQKRDMETLCKSYKPIASQGVDMFPYTVDCENIILFKLKVE